MNLFTNMQSETEVQKQLTASFGFSNYYEMTINRTCAPSSGQKCNRLTDCSTITTITLLIFANSVKNTCKSVKRSNI